MANPDNASQQRREEINQSSGVLPGDQQRADDEEQGNFDSADTGNFGTQTVGENKSDPAHRDQVNQSSEVLPGDQKRAYDDQQVDSGAGDGKSH